MNFTGKIFLTGGSGSMGQAFMQKAQDEGWDCEITCYSRSWSKHVELRKRFPNATFIPGDILSYEQLLMSMAGHDLVIHMAAFKEVPSGELYTPPVIDTNIDGTRNVLNACAYLGIDAIGISSDKAVSPVNTYGASKMLMERLFQYYATNYPDIDFHLVRYGNVFGSTGSFIHNWIADLKNPDMDYVRSTDAEMTRFWLTTDDALNLIYYSLYEPSGCVLIPQARAAQIGQIEKWLIPPDVPIEYMGVRPGEKIHECLLNEAEAHHAQMVMSDEYIRLYPSYMYSGDSIGARYSNDLGAQMKKDEFMQIAGISELDL